MKLAFISCLGLAILALVTPAHSDWKPNPVSIQRVYLDGVPHTDANGQMLKQYDPNRSFLPIGIYHALNWEEEQDGNVYRFSDLKEAGFTTAFSWWGLNLPKAVKDAEACKLQLVIWGDNFEDKSKLEMLAKSPAVLAYNMDDEPIGSLENPPETGIVKRFADIERRAKIIREIDKVHPLLQVDASWIQSPATDWWIKLNTWGDISAHDNYPINSQNTSLSMTQGIPETISLAVASNRQQKPVWFVAQAHEWPNAQFPNTFSTATQQRCMTYTALIHGATGIVHFAQDSFVTRDGKVVGISPNPKAKYRIGMVATENQLRQSKALWDSTVILNSELNTLRPSLLSPTADIPYEVAVDDKWKSITETPIRTLLKINPAGGYTLLMANVDGTFEGTRIRFPGEKFTVKPVFDPENAGQFERKDDGFEFVAAPFEVRVFQIDMQ